MNIIEIMLIGFGMMISMGAAGALAYDEQEISLSQVPRIVMDAAQNAVPGGELSNAAMAQTQTGRIYFLDGVVGDKEYGVEVSEKGEILEIETVGSAGP